MAGGALPAGELFAGGRIGGGEQRGDRLQPFLFLGRGAAAAGVLGNGDRVGVLRQLHVRVVDQLGHEAGQHGENAGGEHGSSELVRFQSSEDRRVGKVWGSTCRTQGS